MSQKKSQKILYQGAEAIITLENNAIVKDRIKKSYRIPELDEKIRKSRTKHEAKLLEKAYKIIDTPKTIEVSKDKITMQYIKGKRLSDWLNKLDTKKQTTICKQIGKDVAKLHNQDIIHGDLTTSNMILVEDFAVNKTNNLLRDDREFLSINKKGGSEQSELLGGNKQASASPSSKIFFIDFGLGFHSKKIEDKAVDIHLLKQALEAKHFQNWENLFRAFLQGYITTKQYTEILNQLKKVESRGRYKEKY